MGIIMHENVAYGGGSVVEANPQESATEQLETLGIDGDVYEVTDANAVHSTDVGVANGVAELDSNGKVPSSQLPSYVDDVVEYASTSAFPATGESGKIYVALDTNLTYRWSGTEYVEISPSLALGETSSTAYRGDRGKIAYDHSQSDHSTIKPAFTEAATRANIASGESFATLLGKIKKWFSDLKDLAFIGKDGTSSTKYLRGDGTWQNFPTIPTKTSDLTNDSGFVTTDEKVTGEVKNPTASTTYNVPFVNGTTNQKPFINDGLNFNTYAGTTSTTGRSQLKVGNNIETGTAGNKYGELLIYSEKSGFARLKMSANSTADRSITFQDKTGTVALTSDVPAAQIQSDWNQTSSSALDYIKNKPSVMTCTRGQSVSTEQMGYWGAMCNTTQTGSPTLPTAGQWWHVFSMDWSNDYKNWVSQLAIATQQNSGVFYRKNDTGGVTINDGVWRRLADSDEYVTGGIRLNNGSVNATGKFIKIKINSTNAWMLCFTVTLYQDYRATKVMVSGYQHGSNYWYNPEAIMIADSDKNTELATYFGYDSVGHLWVAFDAKKYTGVFISDVANGYSWASPISNAGDPNLNGLFAISIVDSLSTTQVTTSAKVISQRTKEVANWYSIENGTGGRPTTADLKSNNSGGMRKFIATATMSTNKPMADGHIIQLDWDNGELYGAQLYVPNSNPASYHMQYRTQGGGTWSNWVTLIDSNSIGSQSVDKATKDGDGNTISSTYAKKSDIATFEADGSAGTGTGYRRIALINITTPGKYLVTAWMSTNGSGRKGIAISNSSNSNYRASWNSDNVDTSYPITMTCIDVITVSSTLYLQARAYNTNSSTTGEPGGIYAVKIS